MNMELLHVNTRAETGKSVLPEQKLTDAEREELRILIDGFFSPTDNAAKLYQKELEAKDAFGCWSAARRHTESIEAVVKQKEAFNCHDECWTEYEVLCVEKITQNDYEAGSAELPEGDSYAAFAGFEQAAGGYRVWNIQGYKKGTINGWELRWETYVIAYLAEIRNLPGFYRVLYAKGNDR